MQFKTLERELQARILLHKVAITKSYLANSYIREQKQGNCIVLPDIYLEQEAMEYADRKTQDILIEGKLDEVYNNAWEQIVQYIPNHFSVT